MNFLNYMTHYVVKITKKEEKFCSFSWFRQTLTIAESEFALTSRAFYVKDVFLKKIFKKVY